MLRKREGGFVSIPRNNFVFIRLVFPRVVILIFPARIIIEKSHFFLNLKKTIGNRKQYPSNRCKISKPNLTRIIISFEPKNSQLKTIETISIECAREFQSYYRKIACFLNLKKTGNPRQSNIHRIEAKIPKLRESNFSKKTTVNRNNIHRM